MDRAGRIAIVVLGVAVAATAAMLYVLAAPATIGDPHELTVPAGEAFERTFTWERNVLRPGPLVGDPLPVLSIRYDGSGTTGWTPEIERNATGGLVVRALYVVNGEEIHDQAFFFRSEGAFDAGPMTQVFADWSLWRNAIRVTAVVENTPIEGIAGTYGIAVGPVEIEHRARSSVQPIAGPGGS